MSTSSASTPSTPTANSTPLSQKQAQPEETAKLKEPRQPPGPTGQDILLFLIASRLLNALVVQTFFQPDEYFQSLEPAWDWAFGAESGAWITWEWKNHLRSAIHPAIFAFSYRAADVLADVLNLSASARAQVLLATPKTLQALIAAVGDYYTWKLAGSIYGTTSVASGATLILTVASPWQWFCSTRTLSNCLETTLTVIALYNWPWHWSVPKDEQEDIEVDSEGLRLRDGNYSPTGAIDETTKLRRALLCAALATVLRPTNVLIWFILTLFTFLRSAKSHWLVKVPGTEQSALVHFSAWSFVPSRTECIVFARETVACGSAILLLSATVDRVFYKAWAFPPYNFLYFNVVQSLAIFYGNNDWHYYVSQGYPLLLTTALPFTLVGLYHALSEPAELSTLSLTSRNTLKNLAVMSIFVPAILSTISHKEVRFIYPILPALHILTAHPVTSFFAPAFQHSEDISIQTRQLKRLLLLLLICLSFLISLYTTTTHNSGLINVTHHLRDQFESHYLPNPSNTNNNTNMTIAFLTPCHSTPWRSHLQYPPTSGTPGIDAWALTCEPPLHLSPDLKATYHDEADLFYADPAVWLKKHMSRHAPSPETNHAPGVFAPHSARPRRMFQVETSPESDLYRGRSGRRPWPHYLVFFSQLEPTLTQAMRGSGYTECKRIWNSRWHDDWRRTGDVVVWCLFPDRAEVAPEATQEDGKNRSPWANGFRLKAWKKAKTLLQGDGTRPPTMQDVKDALHDPPAGASDVGGRVLGDLPIPPAKPVERVVEKPFWKQRPPLSPDEMLAEEKEKETDEREMERGFWARRFPGIAALMDQRKTREEKDEELGSWWERNAWT